MRSRSLGIALFLLAACTSDLGRFKIGLAKQDAAGRTSSEAGVGPGKLDGSSAANDSGTGHEGAASSPSDAGDAASNPPAADADAGQMPCTSQTIYPDVDHDEYGDDSKGQQGCLTQGFVTRAGDCDDNDEHRNPGVAEACNGVDDNCDHATDEDCACTSGTMRDCGAPDGHGGLLNTGLCKLGKQHCVNGAWGDCADSVGPMPDTCDTFDNDCDGMTDEGVQMALYADHDGDGYGRDPIAACGIEFGIVGEGGDCDDADGSAYPGAPESCNPHKGDDCNPATDPPCPTTLPAIPTGCPTLATGSMTVFGLDTQLWVGTRMSNRQGPIVIYFHGSGSTGSEISFEFPGITEVTNTGGIVIAPNTSTQMGTSVPNGTWYTGDIDAVDKVVGCALQQLNIDTRHISVMGTSFGGVFATNMAYARSGYIASVTTNSGGLYNQSYAVLQDAAHVPAVMTEHGVHGSDVVVVDFSDVSLALDHDIVGRGGFAVDCDDGGGHASAPTALTAAAWLFVKDHPFAVRPEPYASMLPASFPSYCKVIKP